MSSSIRHGCLFAALLLAGCAGNDHDDLKAFVDQSGQNLRGRVDATPGVAAPETLAYAAQDLPDPFSPARTRAPGARKLAGTQWAPPASKEALEAYPLAALSMVGTMQRHGERWALIRTPDNTIYRITRGNRLGENFGAVAEITESALTLNEHVEDGTGLWTERVATLNLLEDAKTN